MNIMDIVLNAAIGLITGMISGALSGILVTRYYRKKDEVLREKEQHEQAIFLAIDFFEDLQIEISRAEEKEDRDYSRILGILARKQRYLLGLIRGRYAIELSVYDDIMGQISSIELKLKKGILDFEKDKKEIQNLYLTAFKILY